MRFNYKSLGETSLHPLRQHFLEMERKTIKKRLFFLGYLKHFAPSDQILETFTSSKLKETVKILILSIFDAVPVKLNLFQMVFSGSSHRVLYS